MLTLLTYSLSHARADKPRLQISSSQGRFLPEQPAMSALLSKDALLQAFTFIAVLLYLAVVVRHQIPGLARLTFSLPALLLFASVPLKAPALTIRGGLAFILGWLANAKVRAWPASAPSPIAHRNSITSALRLRRHSTSEQRGPCNHPVCTQILAFSAGRGPLAHPGLSALQFTALLLLPVYSMKHSAQSALRAHPHRSHRPSVRTVIAKTVLKGCLLVGMTLMLTGPTPIPSLVRHACYGMSHQYTHTHATPHPDTSTHVGMCQLVRPVCINQCSYICVQPYLCVCFCVCICPQLSTYI